MRDFRSGILVYRESFDLTGGCPCSTFENCV
jgi:hypothetical protein